jgi:regulator of sigma E protease
MEDILIKAGQFLLGISILVIIHELGHFLAARAFGIKVEKFYLFFDVGGKKLLHFKKGDTEYGIGWLPLGGYVKIVGMIDESMDKDFAKSEPQPWEFRSKPTWQRLIVMMAGIFMNVILGILIFTLHTFYYGEKFIPTSELQNGIAAHSIAKKVGFQTGDIPLSLNGKPFKRATDIQNMGVLLDDVNVYEVERKGEKKTITLPDTMGKAILNTSVDSFLEVRQRFAVKKIAKDKPAEKAGLRAGDSILAVNDTATHWFGDFTEMISHYPGKQIKLKVKRGNDILPIACNVDPKGMIGIEAALNLDSTSYNLPQSFLRGSSKAWHAIADNAKGLWKLVKGDLPAKKSVHGLIGIANAYGSEWEWSSFWSLTGLLSMVLAIMNFLPIPALDGGHVLFLLVEMVRRKPLSYRFLEVAQMVGMGLIFLLMGFALYNDITQYIFKK